MNAPPPPLPPAAVLAGVLPRPYITCRELIDFIGEYLDGTLPAGARHEFERHLTVCPSCVAYLSSYRRTVELEIWALADTEPVSSLPAPDGLVRAVRAARAKRAG